MHKSRVGKGRVSESEVLGIRQMPAKRMIVSLLTPPEPITLSLSSVFWAALLSLLIAASISFFKNFRMVRAFPFVVGGGRFLGDFIPAHLRHLPAVSALQKG